MYRLKCMKRTLTYRRPVRHDRTVDICLRCSGVSEISNPLVAHLWTRVDVVYEQLRAVALRMMRLQP